jgi:FixJ family two-component response regulator
MSDEAFGIGQPLVRVVDDETALRLSLDSLFRSVGLRVAAFASVQELLADDLPEVPGCLVLDVRLPGLSGLDFLSHPTRREDALPVVFMTGHGDIPMSVRAMKAGAVDFLAKPFHDQDMLDAVAAAIRRDRARRAADAAGAVLRARFATLTPREKQVMALVVTGLMNKQVAYEVRAVQRCGMRRRLRRRSRPPMAARKRSWASELRRLDLRMLKAKLRSLAKMPGLMRMRERSSPMVTSRL